MKVWKDDNWVKTWIAKEPLIGSEDLRPYFYFARSVLDKQYDGTTKLSKVAQDVLKNLLAGTESGLTSAIKNADRVNDYEAGIIIDHLFERIRESSEIEDMHLRALLEWGSKKKETHTGIIKLSGVY